MMKYKDYAAKVEYDDGAGCFHGQVVNIRDVITFQGRSVDELRQEFANSVEDYIEFCAERGEKPERPYSGKFVVRIDPDLHRRIAIAAINAGLSVNSWASRTFEEAVAPRPTPSHVSRDFNPATTAFVMQRAASVTPEILTDRDAWQGLGRHGTAVPGSHGRSVMKSRIKAGDLDAVLGTSTMELGDAS